MIPHPIIQLLLSEAPRVLRPRQALFLCFVLVRSLMGLLLLLLLLYWC